MPSHIWILTDAVDDARRRALLSTPYEAIVAEIASKGVLSESKAVPNTDSIFDHTPGSLARYRIEIQLPCDIVDLFHNGAGGYRAQFYESIELGEKANDYCRDAVLSLLACQRTKKDRNWIGTPEAASLYCRTTKVWIHQGLWLRQEWIRLRNLRVSRWQCDEKTADTDRRERWRRSMLAPDHETRINLIGGWLRSSDQKPLGKNHKPLRSRHIHYLGFT